MQGTWLILETSGRAGRVGLTENGQVVAQAVLDEARRHARDLAATVQTLLSGRNQTAKDVSGVMVGIGPGSFTGLRVGITSAKAFAYAVGCPLIAVPTFPAIALRTAGATIDVISDGLRQQVYCQRFQNGQAINELKITTVDDWVASLPDGSTVTGPGVSVYDSVIPNQITRTDDSLRMPSVESLLDAGRSLTPVTRDELFALEPLYLRASSAEEQRARGVS